MAKVVIRKYIDLEVRSANPISVPPSRDGRGRAEVMNGRSAPRAVIYAHRTRGSVGRCHELTERLSYPRWFNRLNAQAAAKVMTTLVRLEMVNLSGVKSVGAGVIEHRLDFGPL